MYTLDHSVCNSFATERATVLVEKRDRSSTTALGGLLAEASANAGPIFPLAHRHLQIVAVNAKVTAGQADTRFKCL